MKRKKILVLCTGNSCRSQMAEGYLRNFAQGNAEIYSAGIESHGVNPLAIRVMQEDHIDISSQTSDLIDSYLNLDFQYIITVCDHAKEQCPYISSNAIKIHHNFKDPSKKIGTEEEIISAFRDTRDEIKEFCQDLISNYILKHIQEDL